MWSKFDDQFYLNPKNATISRDEQDLYIAGIIYCNGQLTDGFIPAGVLIMLCSWAKIEFEAKPQALAQALAKQLIKHNYWEIAEGGYQVHDFLEWNMSRDEVTALRAARSEAGKVGGQISVAKRQALALANAQAKSKQNSTQSQSPSLVPQEKIAPAGARKSSTKDERTDYPAIQAIKTVTGKLPNKANYATIINKLGDQVDIPKLHNCFDEWTLRGYNPTNYSGLLDWYRSGIPPARSNGKGKSGMPVRPPEPAMSPEEKAKAKQEMIEFYEQRKKERAEENKT